MDRIKRSKFAVTFLAAVFLLLCGISMSAGTVSASAKRFEPTLKPAMTSIQVSWPQKKGAVKYKVLRADVTKAIVDEGEWPAQDTYKKVKVTKGKKATSFDDKTVKSGRYYAYVIRAYNKKGKQIASSYDSDQLIYAVCGLGQPDLHNDGYGENYTNSRKALHLYIEPEYAGVSAKNAVAYIYRKTAGGKKYKKIGSVRMKDGAAEYTDKTVKSGKTYDYRVRLVKQSGGKTYKSKKSTSVRIPAVNFKAKYKVKCMTPAGNYKDREKLEIKIRLKNGSKHNGTTTVMPKSGQYYDAEYFAGKGKNQMSYPFAFTKYSTDNKTWKAIPAKGVMLPKTAPLYLKGEITRGDNEYIRFEGGKKGATSLIDAESDILKYAGSGVGYTSVHLDLAGGTGSAYLEWD